MANGSRRRTPSRRPRKSGGGGGIVSKAIGLVLGAAIIFAIYGIPYNPTVTGVWGILAAKSETLKTWVTGLGQQIESGVDSGGTYDGGSGSGPDAPGAGGDATNIPQDSPDQVNSAKAGVEALTVGDAQDVDYNRDEWKQWSSQGSSCWDTRDAVLYRSAVQDATLVLLDKNKTVTTDLASACSIKSGTWNEPYTGKVFTNPTKLDIDHMIPLGYVAEHGGQAWDLDKKEKYANDLADPGHLLAVDASSNRSKSDQGPAEWKPSNQAFYCSYATDWVTVATAYSLTVTQADKDALKSMLATCP